MRVKKTSSLREIGLSKRSLDGAEHVIEFRQRRHLIVEPA
jgi:hypothetical protein